MRKSQPKRLEFSKAMKSFMGYLEGTQKAAHTIKNYKLDIQAFQRFLEARYKGTQIACELLTETDLAAYGDFLSAQGQKTNTRRRKLLTAHRFLRYLSQRKQLFEQLPTKLPAPHKMERVPYFVPQLELISAIQEIKADQPLERRNRALLWVLAETGCQVSEVVQLKYDHWELKEGKAHVTIPGKAERTLLVTRKLLEEVQSLEVLSQKSSLGQKWIFLGFNKHGSLGAPISARGVELLVRFYSSHLNLPKLTPRTFRHSAVLGWFQEGTSQEEIQRRLGLRTAYAFRSYAPLLNSESCIPVISDPTHPPHPLPERFRRDLERR